MYILSYIKQYPQLILIAGESGIGKTTLIDSLIEREKESFSQPLSFTSRQKRNENERYCFIGKGEIVAAYERGDLLNLDEVFGEFYGISKNSTISIIKSGRFAIKEVHPKNFHKFDNLEINILKILIVNKHYTLDNSKFELRADRKESYDDYENESYKYDIIINISGLMNEEASDLLILKIYLFLSGRKSYPHPAEIDYQNKIGYDQVAPEFKDDLRVTTRNFHDASLSFWHNTFNSILKESSKRDNKLVVLELGVGNGWLFNTFPYTDYLDIDCLDISPIMSANYGINKFIGSSRCVPVKSANYDLVLGSLSDPFLYPESVSEVLRVLKVGGRFIATFPSKVWADGLSIRKENRTFFQLKSGKKTEVFSFCNFETFLDNESSIIGFAVEHIKSYCLGKNYLGKVSEAIIESAKNLQTKPLHLPIITSVICRKA